MSRSSYGTGSITYDEKRKRYQGRLVLPTGERRSVWGKKRREVQEKLAQLRREVEAGMHGTDGGQQTFREFAEMWLMHHQELEPRTVEGYRSILNVHFDGIGDLPLTKLTPAIVQAHYTRKLQIRATTTVAHIHAFMQVVLENAVKLGILPRNPAHSVDAPPIKTKEFQPLNTEQVQTLMAGARGTRYEAVYVLAVATGMREAELLGLAWEDIDWARQLVRVEHTLHRITGQYQLRRTKSRMSRRALPLTDYVAAILAEHQMRQAEQRDLLGDAWGEIWNLVFTTEAGKPVNPGPLLKEFRRLLRATSLPEETRIHDLRHTFATLLLERGVHIKVVSELLGHNSVEITLRIYGHVTPRMQGTAVSEINALMPAPIVEGSVSTLSARQRQTADNESTNLEQNEEWPQHWPTVATSKQEGKGDER